MGGCFVCFVCFLFVCLSGGCLFVCLFVVLGGAELWEQS